MLFMLFSVSVVVVCYAYALRSDECVDDLLKDCMHANCLEIERERDTESRKGVRNSKRIRFASVSVCLYLCRVVLLHHMVYAHRTH